MEADKTNEFLQAMAEAATDSGINRQGALAAVLGVRPNPLLSVLAFFASSLFRLLVRWSGIFSSSLSRLRLTPSGILGRCWR